MLPQLFKSDIYLNLSRIESFGITFIESLSCNLPIITFDRKGANEIVKNLNNGFVIKNRDFSSFIKYLNRFYKDKNFFKNRPYLSSRKYDLDQLIYNYIKTYPMADFDAVAQKMRDAKLTLSNDQKGEIYGLFKQGSIGDNTNAAPYAIQIEAKAKWTAWEAKKGMSQDDAKQAYVDYCTPLLA